MSEERENRDLRRADVGVGERCAGEGLAEAKVAELEHVVVADEDCWLSVVRSAGPHRSRA